MHGNDVFLTQERLKLQSVVLVYSIICDIILGAGLMIQCNDSRRMITVETENTTPAQPGEKREAKEEEREKAETKPAAIYLYTHTQRSLGI